ncbi:MULTISPECIES: amidohydrolase [unclassified Ensifer]|uniref:amidohydrolase family protein n=1 Tax=unclassified Ensifer TaxID=2633371 RepID=UPI00088C2341|nr:MULTISPECIES: amidohydrolase family protein [unclassified Ensifer]SDN51192.1 Predicted metal-dependent hydrolase, TIM-barrel fold [Ensifer sp. YR511]
MHMSRREFIAGTLGAAAAVAVSTGASGSDAVPYSSGDNKPSFKAPANTCDAHFHIYDKRFPAAPNASLVPPDALVKDYEKLRTRLGFERSVIVQPSTYGTDNSCLVEALENLGARARGIAVVDTSVSDEQLKELNAAGIRGIRFNLGRAGATTIEMIEPLSKRVAELGWHIQVHMSGNDITKNADLFARLPVTIVFDHLGRIPQPESIKHPAFAVVSSLLEQGKAYTKLSSIYQDTVVGPPSYEDMGAVARAYIKVAPDRVLWASDWPHPSPGKFGKPNDATLMDLCADWAGDNETRQKIFVDNAAKLYGF